MENTISATSEPPHDSVTSPPGSASLPSGAVNPPPRSVPPLPDSVSPTSDFANSPPGSVILSTTKPEECC